MRARGRSGLRSAILSAALAACTLGQAARPAPGHAWHDEQERILDRTAYNLRQGELRLGPLRWGVGAFDWLTIETLPVPWIVGAVVDETIPNLFLRSTFYDRRSLALGLEAGFLYAGIEDDGNFATFLLVPLRAAASYRFDDVYSTHLRLTYAAVAASADVSPKEHEIAGQLATSLLHLDASLEVRLSRALALLFTVRYLPWHDDAAVQADVTVDESLSADVRLDVHVDDLDHAYAVLASTALSFDWLDVRLGIGWGDIFALDGALVVPWDFVLLDLAIYARFGG